MSHYILSFSVYTMAMIGLIFFALFIYKKFSPAGLIAKKRGTLKIDDVLSLSPRKTLYVIKAGGERFLLAADIDRTTLISKLNSTEEVDLDAIDERNSFCANVI